MKNKNTITIYGFRQLSAIAEMFKNHGFELDEITTRGTDVKPEKNWIFIHNSDTIQEDLTTVKCRSENEDAKIKTWFTLRSHNPKDFDAWEIESEMKTFKKESK